MAFFKEEVEAPKLIDFYYLIKDHLSLPQKYNAIRVFLMTEMTRNIKVLKVEVVQQREEYNYAAIIIRCELTKRWRVKDGEDFYYKDEDSDFRFTLRTFFGLDSWFSYNNSILIHNPYYREEGGFPDNRAMHEKKKWYEIPLRKGKPKEREIQERFNLMDANLMPFSRY